MKARRNLVSCTDIVILYRITASDRVLIKRMIARSELPAEEIENYFHVIYSSREIHLFDPARVSFFSGYLIELEIGQIICRHVQTYIQLELSIKEPVD
jgi:hypothetical protein